MRIGTGFFKVLAAFSLAVGIAGCSGGGGGTLADPTIRFVNSSPDSNPLDFMYDTTTEAASLNYSDSSGDVTVDDGDHDVSVIDTTDQTVLDAVAQTFSKDKKYIALTKGLTSFGSELEKRIRLFVFEYDKNAPNGNKARLLIVHAFNRAPGFLTPDLDFQNPGENPLVKVADISYDSPDAQSVDIDTDGVTPITFEARRAGTENVYASSTDTFDAGGIYLALVTGVEDAAGAQAPKIQYIKLN